MDRQELVDAFSFIGINRSNAVVNFTEKDPLDPKALWLNAEHIRALAPEELAQRLLPFVSSAGFLASLPRMLQIVPLIRERIKVLSDVVTVGDFFFVEELSPYDPAELVPQKGNGTLALSVLRHACTVLSETYFSHDALENALRNAASELGIKTGQMFQPIRVAVCGRKNAPPLFATLEVLGKDVCLKRISQAIEKLERSAGSGQGSA
jgi:glutamyl-tRNA synthetase